MPPKPMKSEVEQLSDEMFELLRKIKVNSEDERNKQIHHAYTNIFKGTIDESNMYQDTELYNRAVEFSNRFYRTGGDQTDVLMCKRLYLYELRKKRVKH